MARRKRQPKFHAKPQKIDIDKPENYFRAGLVAAAKSMKMCAPAIRAITPVFVKPRKGMSTFGIDKHFRVYADPEAIMRWVQMARDVSSSNPCETCGATSHHHIAYVGGVICHEVWHPLREHPARAEEMHITDQTFMRWNAGTDCEINDDLLEIFKACQQPLLCLPPGGCFPEKWDMPEGKLAEFYYHNFPENDESDPQPSDDCEEEDEDQQSQSQSQQQDDQDQEDQGDQQEDDEGDGAGDGDEESDEGDGDSDDGDGQGEGDSDEDGDGDSDDGEGDGDGDGEGDGDGDGDGQGEGEGQGDGQGQGKGKGSGKGQGQGNGQGGNGTPGGGGGGGGHAQGPGQSPGQGQSQQGTPPVGGCGSGCDGRPRPWDLGDPGPGKPGISEAEGRLIRKKVAQEIQKASTSRGTVPAGFLRWADGVLEPPKYNWRAELKKAVPWAINRATGDEERTYRRLSRRCAAIGYKAILASTFRPKPVVKIGFDTSGSMGGAEPNGAIQMGVNEVEGIVRAVGAEVYIIAGDAAADETQTIRGSVKGKLELHGGGGTDMRVLIQQALDEAPFPNVIIIVTDGHTPWPEERLPNNCRLVVCLVGNHAVDVNNPPDWATVVKIIGDDVETKLAA